MWEVTLMNRLIESINKHLRGVETLDGQRFRLQMIVRQSGSPKQATLSRIVVGGPSFNFMPPTYAHFPCSILKFLDRGLAAGQ